MVYKFYCLTMLLKQQWVCTMPHSHQINMFNLGPAYTNRDIFETAYCFYTNRPCVHTTFGESAHRVASFRNRFKTLSTRFWVKEYAVKKNIRIRVDAAYNRFSFSLRIQPFLLIPRR